MKPILLACTTLAVLLLPFASARPQDDEHEETELAHQMETIEDTVKLLRKHLKEPATWPQALEALAEIERLSLACKALAPASAEKLPEAERAAFVTAYRRTMVDFLMRQLELEAALLDGDAEATKAAFDRFRAMEDSAHERFAPEDG
ncbi:MAG TPA: hypothetical protein VF530_08165 [Planctomycetota bacterium]